MKTSLKTGFAKIFSCCPKNLSCPKFGGTAVPLAPPPPAHTPMDGGSVTWERAVNNYRRTRLGNWKSEGKRKTVRVGEEFEFSG